jgi:hypothetical protein
MQRLVREEMIKGRGIDQHNVDRPGQQNTANDVSGLERGEITSRNSSRDKVCSY